MQPDDPLKRHFRLAQPQQAALKKLRLETVHDLLYHFPTRYERPGAESSSQALTVGSKVTLIGEITKLEAKKLWKSRRAVAEGWFEDRTGRVKLMWFNQPYMASYVPERQLVRIHGTVGGRSGQPYIANPEVEKISSEDAAGLFARDTAQTKEAPPLFPVYPESYGITSRWFYHALRKVFEHNAHAALEDPIPSAVRDSLHLPTLPNALIWIHQPEDERHAQAAKKRFSFEEMFVLQASRALERVANDRERAFSIAEGAALSRKFLDTLPLKATSAQERAVADIAADLALPHPMARLLEGDVGSGKTLVAAAASFATVNSRPPKGASGLPAQAGTLQVAYMAPTEILASQHFESFIQYFKHLPISIALMTGSGCKKFPSKISRDRATDISRAQLLKWVKGGEIAMLVGTHALIQKSVEFKHLALAIVDEQHRFGTAQRRELARKGAFAPHFLSMTATPIPRTLALSIYGDLDLSVLDELPPGRQQIATRIVYPKERDACYEEVRECLRSGRQAYVICPRIEEPDPAKLNALQAKSAKAEAKRLKKDVFPEYEIGLLYGSMPAKGGFASSGKPSKEQVMRDFADHKIDILVATSVVEVGVNVANATVILIEGAERFGLAQLHQLRGRVQRSSHASLCFLLPESRGELTMKRLKALERSSNGFELAEQDLATRGPGDLYGKQQWGISDLGMEALKNPRLIEAARKAAQQLAANDPSLAAFPALASRIKEAHSSLHEE